MSNPLRGLVLVSVLVGGCQVAPVEPIRWRPLLTGSQASLRGLSAVDEQVAYVSGSGGTLLRTMDGGESWDSVAPPGTSRCDFRDVEALDRDQVVAMVAGQPARVYRSEDAGATWRLVHEDPREAAFFDALAFAGDVGVMFGDAIDGQFCMLQSHDGGRSWRDRSGELLPPPGDGEAAFAASGTCLVAIDADRGVFSLVTGGGQSRAITFGSSVSDVSGRRYWSRGLPLQSGSSSQGAFSVAWDGARGVAVGGDYRAPEAAQASVAITTDGGATWAAGDAGGFRSAVIWLSSRALLAVGSHGASWSKDGGRTWIAFGQQGFHCLSRGGDGSVWAAGSDGRVARLMMAR